MSPKKLPKPNLNLPLVFSEKITPKKEIVIRTQEEIDSYKKAIGYRKARIKRYGKVPAKKAR
ncbi:hypothetical protein J4218_04215 [Candidatus Pacearchaeota archaeon]|nr:hypothetical protein [Candidatus Pacearchaeota archaeon]